MNTYMLGWSIIHMLILSHLMKGEDFLGLKGLLGTLRKEAVVDVMFGA
jgi:hypothetical protein